MSSLNANRTTAPDLGCFAPSSLDPVDVRISTTESLFGSRFKRLLQQNRPQVSPSVALRGARDDVSRPRCQAVLPERGKTAKVHDGSGFIWRIPV